MLRLFNPPLITVANQIPSTNFNYQSPAHLEIINKKIERFKQTQDALIVADNNMVIGLLVGSTCWVSSYIFPTVSLSIAGFCFATLNATQRKEHFKLYKEALNDLIAIYQWSMGRETGNHWYKIALNDIQNLITTLGPWVSKKTLCTWDADALKPGKVAGLTSNRRNEIPEEFEEKLHRLMSETQISNWRYQLYGENCNDDAAGFAQSYATKKANEIIASISLRR